MGPGRAGARGARGVPGFKADLQGVPFDGLESGAAGRRVARHRPAESECWQPDGGAFAASGATPFV
jgi:hypothetical protein